MSLYLKPNQIQNRYMINDITLFVQNRKTSKNNNSERG